MYISAYIPDIMDDSNGSIGDKKKRPVLYSLWAIYAKENLQCACSLQKLLCTMFLISYKLA